MDQLFTFWRQLTPWQQSALIGAGVTGGLSSSYVGLLNACCCLGVIAGAILAVQQYHRRTDGPVPSGDGALLGLTAGVGGAVFAALIEFGMRIVGIGLGGATERLVQLLPESVEVSQNVAEWQGRGELFWFAGELIGEMLLFAVFGAIGGAIGAALFDRRRSRPEDGTVPRSRSQEEESDEDAASNKEGSV